MSRVTGVVLAWVAARRLSQPKQILPYRDSTVLGETLRMARRCGFDQLIVTLGGAAEEVRRGYRSTVPETVVVDDPASGCAASLRVAVERWTRPAPGLCCCSVISPASLGVTVRRLIEAGG